MDKNYINSWIEIAIKDIEVSELLYKNKLYSNSFYHFQQASEKSLKAFLFLNKTLSSAFHSSGLYLSANKFFILWLIGSNYIVNDSERMIAGLSVFTILCGTEERNPGRDEKDTRLYGEYQ